MLFDLVMLGAGLAAVGIVAGLWRWFDDDSWLEDRPDGWRQPHHFDIRTGPYDWEREGW